MSVRHLALAVLGLALLLPLTTPIALSRLPHTVAVTETPLRILLLAGPFLLGLLLMGTDSWLGAFVASTALGALWGPPLLAVEVAWAVSLGALALVAARAMPGTWDRRVAWAFAALGVFEVGYAVQQWLGYDILWRGQTQGTGLVVHGTVGNPDTLAVLLVLCAVVAPWPTLPVLAGGVLLSNCQTAMVALALVIVARWPSRGLVALTAFAGLVWALWFPPALSTLEDRVLVWRLALSEPTGPSLLVGHGSGSWWAEMPRRQVAAGWSALGLYTRAHSEYVQLAYEGGLVALGCLGAWLWSWRRSLLRPAFVAVGVVSLTLFPFHLAVTALPATVLLGLATRGDA